MLIGEASDSRHRGPGVYSEAVTFMFADLEGSTGLLRRLGDTFQLVLHAYHGILSLATSTHRGHVVRTEGDGFFCVFASPVDAVEAAFQAQTAMAQEEWPENERPRCRIGVHTGTATQTPEGYVGMDVHIAARIGDAAQGGQILLSKAACDLVSAHVGAKGWSIVDLGHFHLKGIDRSEHLLRLDIPGLDIVAVAPRARPRTPTTVPTSPRPIVGRTEDVKEAKAMLLRDQVRIVTLTGPGGTGKTRLAIELAHRLEGEFPDGIVFVDLSAVRDPDRFLPVVGRALGVRESKKRTIPKALRSVLGDARMLLVLDNMEQLLAAASHVMEILEALPNAKALLTSRSPIGITWEHEYAVQPLSLPETDADIEATVESDAVALFMERTLAMRPYFRLDESTRQVVIDIVRRLDGLPLAIELAAARLRALTLEELRDRLDDRLGVLNRGSVDAPERHRTLRSAIQWSYDLLEPDEKSIFRHLAVFSGGWVLEAALSVCTDGHLQATRVVDILENLVSKSLVVFSVDEQGRPRYRMLETLREFGLSELRHNGEGDDAELRHLRWCRALAEKMMLVLPTPGFPEYLDDLELERFNVRDALAWSASARRGLDDALTVCGMLPLFWDTRGYVSEGLRWIRILVEMTSADGVTLPRAIAHVAMGWLEILAGDAEESQLAFSTAVQMLRDLGENEWLGRALAMAGMTSHNRNDPDRAEAEFIEAIELNKRYGLDWLAEAWCEYGLAHVALLRGDYPQAEERLLAALTYSRDHDLIWGIGYCQLSLAVLALTMGDLEQSLERTFDSIRARRALRDSRGLCDCLGMMALHASIEGDHRLAATLLGAGERARQAAGYAPLARFQGLLDQATETSRTALADDFEARRNEGYRLSMDEAVDLAVSSLTRSPDDLPGLSEPAPAP